MKFEHLWDFNDLPATRQRLSERFEVVRATDQLEEAACILTQLARIDGLEGAFAVAEAKLAIACDLATNQSGEAAVRIALETGRLARDQGDVDRAERSFQLAARQARVSGLYTLALDALHMQAIAASPERAMQLADDAQSLIDCGDPGLRGWLGPILNNLGWTMFDAHRYEDALNCFRRDALLRAELGATVERQIADWNAGFVLRKAGRLEEAEATQAALESEVGESGTGIAFVFEERAELSAARGDWPAARRYAEKALVAHRGDGISNAEEPEKFARLAALQNDASD
ncbi:hypothetical protein [Parasedimentitalea maritima]|uniref:Tetratricopeptide repeat-containing protein n=1 Tax=Parasedimentitalea maritima TaxID=2578117 RepID=A0A6A4R6C9_9RHOB|nr:hypothetical protein [Zongyanglinia marina]KAE9624747.1 hypothetical protein GP644_23215 [Zongyanglinia marina]